MAQIPLTPAQRRELRAQAHHLHPVVMIGAGGLTSAIEREVDHALSAHGLIKIRVFSDDRGQREDILQRLTDTLHAAAVQHIGKLLVVWRKPAVKAAGEKAEGAGRGPAEFKVVKNSKVAGQKPEVKFLRVLGNQRLTAGGIVKKAKPRQASLKKRSLD
ncbi:putative RNA-binding protein, YhbY family [Lampropedia hyalina DSM 16112]|jgi:putative YhbY family RNA-binding protein|uniref:Putative RNA-binding protein, YhbY family n=1 Tax=Lampropedia hyalina DSM 16112 TaxID=1122156 RepID=A0A1M4XRH2_9BURK|nr:YhbY family RNA-binding protein [Lampropedia hyalina]SHE95873.1 putative RNA-binding protein, YhbY family [Lampropedia hyalina DSM 16112]